MRSTSNARLWAPVAAVLVLLAGCGSTRALSTGTTGVGPAALSRRGHDALVLASTGQDARYPGSGLFAHFTGVGRAWWWVE